MRRMQRVTTKIAIATTLALTATLPALQAQAASPGVNDGGVYPSAVPANFTPNIASGAVEAIVQVGSRMIVGGSFNTTVTPTAGAGAGTAVTRHYLFAFNASTGQLDTGFVPSVNGEVDSIVPSADGTAVYVGGKFTSAGGISTRLAELSLSNGARVTAFNGTVNGQIRDMALLNGRLLLAGTFTTAKSVAHGGLASVNATTGAIDPYLSINVSGHHNFGRVANAAEAPVAASQIAVSPDHTRAIVDGNFISVTDGTGTYSRDQIMSINLGANSATVDGNWKSNAYTNACFSSAYDDYVRDVGWSPDGSYFVVSATGGYNGGSFQDCDSASRFDASSSGQNVAPAWIDWTGTDSLYSVAVTSDAVFVGGHQRWLNNPYGQDSAKNGAVPRPGLAALDPANGVPLSWNPGRNPRGHGAEVIYASASGIWVGSDGDFIGPNQYKRQKLAFFPFAGGTPATGDNTGDPHTVFLAGASGNSFTANSFDPSTGAGGPTSSPSNGGGIAWGSVTGAFVLNGRIWYATGGKFYYRTWDGANAFGAAQLVDPYDDPTWDNFQTGSGQTYQSVPPTFYGELPKVTGMFYANRSIYYTMSGSNKLFKRTFSPDTRASSVANQVTGGVISGIETTVVSNGNPVDFTLASGMFVANGFLWYATKLDGKLHKAPWNGTTVSGPSTIDTLATGNWAAPGVFVSPTAVVNGPPTANFTANCTALSCSFDASSSTAPGDTIDSYTWDFGDSRHRQRADDEPRLRLGEHVHRHADHPHHQGKHRQYQQRRHGLGRRLPWHRLCRRVEYERQCRERDPHRSRECGCRQCLGARGDRCDRRTVDGTCRLDADRHVLRAVQPSRRQPGARSRPQATRARASASASEPSCTARCNCSRIQEPTRPLPSPRPSPRRRRSPAPRMRPRRRTCPRTVTSSSRSGVPRVPP